VVRGGAGDVEVEQHGLPVRGQEHVGRLQVQVNQAALVGELKGLGQANADPADGVDVRHLGQVLMAGPLNGKGDQRRLLRLGQSLLEAAARALPGRHQALVGQE